LGRAIAIRGGVTEEDDMATPKELWENYTVNGGAANGQVPIAVLANAFQLAGFARANTDALITGQAALKAAVDALAAKSGTSPQELAAITAAAQAGAAAAFDPVALAAALGPLIPAVDQDDLEAALREVLGSLDEEPPTP
jgi:hypothetical protein